MRAGKPRSPGPRARARALLAATGDLHVGLGPGGVGRLVAGQAAQRLERHERPEERGHRADAGIGPGQALAQPDPHGLDAGSARLHVVRRFLPARQAGGAAGVDGEVDELGAQHAAADPGHPGADAGLVHPLVHAGGPVDAGHHQVHAVEQAGDVAGPLNAALHRRHLDPGVERPDPVRRPPDLRGADVGLPVEELAGEVARLDDVVVQERQPADPQPGQALQHVRPQPAGPQLQHVGAAEAALELGPGGVQRGEVREEGKVAVVALVQRRRPWRGVVGGLQQPGRVQRGHRRLKLRDTDIEAGLGQPLPQLRDGLRARGQRGQQRLGVAVRVVQLDLLARVADHQQRVAPPLEAALLQGDPHGGPPSPRSPGPRRGGAAVQPRPPRLVTDCSGVGGRLGGLDVLNLADLDRHLARLLSWPRGPVSRGGGSGVGKTGGLDRLDLADLDRHPCSPPLLATGTAGSRWCRGTVWPVLAIPGLHWPGHTHSTMAAGAALRLCCAVIALYRLG